jgi:hypothetical protein
VRSSRSDSSAPFFKDPPKDGASGDEYAVQHSSRLFALDRQGRLRAEIYDASPDAIAESRRILTEYVRGVAVRARFCDGCSRRKRNPAGTTPKKAAPEGAAQYHYFVV